MDTGPSPPSQVIDYHHPEILEAYPLPCGLHNLRGLFGVTFLFVALVAVLSFLYDHRVFLVLSTAAWVHEMVSMSRMTYGSFAFLSRLREAWNFDYAQEYATTRTSSSIPFEDAIVYVILPNYDEREDILMATVRQLATSEVASSNVVVVLAMEGREIGALDKADTIKMNCKGWFRDIIATFHPENDDEMRGKAANENYAARQLENHMQQCGIRPENSLIFVCDADSLVPGRLLTHLLTRFCVSPYRYLTTWVPAVTNIGSFWDVPIFSRFMSGMAFLDHVSAMVTSGDLKVPWSTYALSFTAAKRVDYWCPNNCSEDWHMFFKCVSRLGEEYRTESVFLPVVTSLVGDAETYWKGLMDRFDQALRHGLSVQELDFFATETIRRWFVKDPAHQIPLSLRKWLRLLRFYLDPLLSAFGVPFMLLTFQLYSAYRFEALQPYLPVTLEIHTAIYNVFWYMNIAYMVLTVILVASFLRILWYLEDSIPDDLYPPSGRGRWSPVPQYLAQGILFAIPVAIMMGMIPLIFVGVKQIFTAEYVYVCAPKPRARTAEPLNQSIEVSTSQ